MMEETIHPTHMNASMPQGMLRSNTANGNGACGHAWWRLMIMDLAVAAAWTVMRATVCVPHSGTLEHFLAFNAPLPFAARPLVAWLAWPMHACGWLSGRQAFLLIDALGFLAFLPGIRYALHPLVSASAAKFGSLAVPLMMVPAIFISAAYPPIFFPYDMTSIAFIAWGIGFVLRRKVVALAMLLPFATLNRETAILLPAAWILLWWDRLRVAAFLKATAVISLAFAVPRAFALYLTRHQPAPYGSSLPLTEKGIWIIDGNIGWLMHPANIALWIALLGFMPLWLPAVYRHMPSVSKRLLPVLYLQLAALFFSGKLDEARIYAEWIVFAAVIAAPAVVTACGAPLRLGPFLDEDPRGGLERASVFIAKYAPALVFVAAAAAYVVLHLRYPAVRIPG